jgi:hypothetical protein
LGYSGLASSEVINPSTNQCRIWHNDAYKVFAKLVRDAYLNLNFGRIHVTVQFCSLLELLDRVQATVQN